MNVDDDDDNNDYLDSTAVYDDDVTDLAAVDVVHNWTKSTKAIKLSLSLDKQYSITGTLKLPGLYASSSNKMYLG